LFSPGSKWTNERNKYRHHEEEYPIMAKATRYIVLQDKGTTLKLQEGSPNHLALPFNLPPDFEGGTDAILMFKLRVTGYPSMKITLNETEELKSIQFAPSSTRTFHEVLSSPPFKPGDVNDLQFVMTAGSPDNEIYISDVVIWF
jgi:hypothetical protein